jgi:EsV-1-7 cysteine-rich motif
MKRERDSPPLPDSSPPPRTSPDLQQPAGQPFIWLPQPGLLGYAAGLPGPPAPAQLHNYLPGLAAIGHPAYQQMPYYHPPPLNGYMDELSAASGGPGPLPFLQQQQQQLHAALAMQAAHGVPLQYMPRAAARGLGPVGFGASAAAGGSIYDGILDPTSIVMPNAPGLGRFAMPMQHLLGGTLPLPLDQYEELRRASLLPGGPLGSTSFPDVSALRGQQQHQQQQQLQHLQAPWQQQDELVAGSHQEWPPPPRDQHHQQQHHHQQQSSMLPLTLPAAAAASAASASASSVLQQPQPIRSSSRLAASPPQQQQQQQASAPEDENDTDDDDDHYHDNNNSKGMYTPTGGSNTAHSSSIGGGTYTGSSSNNHKIHRCTVPDCKRRAIFGPISPAAAAAASSSSDVSSIAAAAAAASSQQQPLPVRCNTHKEDGQIDLMTPRCKWKSCAKRPSFALPGEKPSYCSIHKGTLTDI